MEERILIASNREEDSGLFEQILIPLGFDLDRLYIFDEIEGKIFNDKYAAIFADYDFIGERAHRWIDLLQKNRCRSCFILYGNNGKAEKISKILQKGVYGYIPRTLLPERIYDTLLGGLENRKAFIEILGLADELRKVNQSLNREKEAFKVKNQELSFINRLSREVVYDLNWDNILPRIIDAGLIQVINLELFAIR